jgi:hypothetical protein
MRAKVRFEIIASVIQIIIGIVVIYSLIRWRLEALTSVNSFEYELWWLILLTAGGIFFFNIIAFELLGEKLFPSEPKEEVEKIPKELKRTLRASIKAIVFGLCLMIMPIILVLSFPVLWFGDLGGALLIIFFVALLFGGAPLAIGIYLFIKYHLDKKKI